jgi:hypothetical protein
MTKTSSLERRSQNRTNLARRSRRRRWVLGEGCGGTFPERAERHAGNRADWRDWLGERRSEAGSREVGSRWRGWERARWNSRCKSRRETFHIVHGHLGFEVSEQFHHGGQTDSGTGHLCAIGVSQLVRDNPLGDPDRGDDVSPETAQAADERVAATRAGQEKAVGRERILGTQEAEALHQPTNEGIHWDQCARFSTCRGVHGWPSSVGRPTETIEG